MRHSPQPTSLRKHSRPREHQPIAPSRTSSVLRQVIALGAAAIGTFALSACVGPPAAEWTNTAAAECPIETSDATGTIRIGYLGSPAGDLYLYDRSVAEACLPNADVQWTRLPTGQDIVKAFASGSIDIASLGSTPAAKALTGPLNLDVSVTRVDSATKSGEALVAKDAESIEDLKGKTIATPFSSTAHYSLLNALRFGGLDPKTDVKITNISPDNLPAAWNSDAIDAAYVWEPTLSEIKNNGKTLTDSAEVAEQGAPSYNLTLADQPWQAANPELLRTWTALQNWAVEQYNTNKEDFTKAIAAQAEISEDSARTQLQGSGFFTGEEQPQAAKELRKALLNTAEFLHSEGDVDTPANQSHYDQAVAYALARENDHAEN